MKKYIVMYYLRNQSKLFSEPQRAICNGLSEFQKALRIIKTNGYELVSYAIVK